MVPAVEYHTATQEVTDDLSQRILRLTRTANPDDIDSWWSNALPLVVRLVRGVTPNIYDVTVKYLNDLAEENDTDLDIPLFEFPAQELLVTSFTVTGPVAFKTAVGRGKTVQEAVKDLQVRLNGSTTRQALNTGRRLVNDAAVLNKQIVGWRRVTDVNPCFFCALLASRGAVYESRETALFSNGDRYHDHCRCHAEPLFKEEEDPRSVRELYDFYLEATEGKSGREALKAFRRAWNTREGLDGRFGHRDKEKASPTR